MPTSVDQIYKQAMKLSETAREKLAERLLQSLHSRPDLKLHPEWDEEIRRRLEDMKSGRVKGHSFQEAMRIIMDDTDEPRRSGHQPARHKRRKAGTPVVRKT